MFRITTTTPLTARGSITAEVVPAAPCALDGCLGELLIIGAWGEGLGRLHLDETNRRELIEALGGVVPEAGRPHRCATCGGWFATPHGLRAHTHLPAEQNPDYGAARNNAGGECTGTVQECRVCEGQNCPTRRSGGDDLKEVVCLPTFHRGCDHDPDRVAQNPAYGAAERCVTPGHVHVQADTISAENDCTIIPRTVAPRTISHEAMGPKPSGTFPNHPQVRLALLDVQAEVDAYVTAEGHTRLPYTEVIEMVRRVATDRGIDLAGPAS